jgi:hypothetical protein
MLEVQREADKRAMFCTENSARAVASADSSIGRKPIYISQF